MANKKTRAVTQEEFELIIKTIMSGFVLPDGRKVKPNERVATCLILEAQLGLRISDIVRLKLADIVVDGGKYRLNDFREKKTGKTRHFLVPAEVYIFLQNYAIRHNLKPTQRMFNIAPRTVQNHLQITCKHLGLQGQISTHSLRKYFSQKIFEENGYDILLVQELLQHSSASITQRYLGVSSQKAEQALKKHIVIPQSA